jgi:hypothetical protein
MRFFNLDLHISVIADLKQIFTDLGHTVDDWCLSNHAWVMGRQKNCVPLMTREDWRPQILQKKLWDEFYDTYHSELDKYDAFICCYPPAFSLLYKRFHKPIIVDIPIRYEYPFHNSKEDWDFFNGYLREGVDQGKIILVANSMYDKKYTEAFLDREVTWIPSLCKYTGIKYQPKRDGWLYYSTQPISFNKNTNIYWKPSVLRAGYNWQDLAEFKGIVHFPYNCSTMSIFEQYQAGIPLFFPRKEFLLYLYDHGFPVLDQLTWRRIFKQSSKSPVIYKGEFDPNDYSSTEVLNYWLGYSDFYYPEALKHVIYFDDFDDLLRKTKDIDTQQLSAQMAIHNKERDVFSYEGWKRIFSQLK